ncbi:MAG: hypothetical protein ABI855_13820 [Bacteroidota bacterium]
MIKSNLKIILLGSMTIYSLQSCNDMYTYTYTLANYADTTINIHVKTNLLDTLYSIETNETKLLYVAEHLGDSHGPDAIDVKEDLTTFVVTKKGITSHRDYLKNETWNFDKGDYKTDVTNNEF